MNDLVEKHAREMRARYLRQIGAAQSRIKEAQDVLPVWKGTNLYSKLEMQIKRDTALIEACTQALKEIDAVLKNGKK